MLFNIMRKLNVTGRLIFKKRLNTEYEKTLERLYDSGGRFTIRFLGQVMECVKLDLENFYDTAEKEGVIKLKKASLLREEEPGEAFRWVVCYYTLKYIQDENKKRRTAGGEGRLKDTQALYAAMLELYEWNPEDKRGHLRLLSILDKSPSLYKSEFSALIYDIFADENNNPPVAAAFIGSFFDRAYELFAKTVTAGVSENFFNESLLNKTY